VQHLGVPLHAGEPSVVGSSKAATGAPGVDRHHVKPSGASVTASPWLIHTD
jgi:hypothetical protein